MTAYVVCAVLVGIKYMISERTTDLLRVRLRLRRLLPFVLCDFLRSFLVFDLRFFLNLRDFLPPLKGLSRGFTSFTVYVFKPLNFSFRHL